MSLKLCIYCSEKISEYAVQCPKCHESGPFDQDKKAEKNLAKEAAKEAELAVEGFIKCKECGAALKISQILRCSTMACEKCGFPGNYIQCAFCQEKAVKYDAIKKTFTCDFHLSQKCTDCGKLISGNEKKIFSWASQGCTSPGGSKLCCEDCYNRIHSILQSHTHKSKSGCFIATATYGDINAYEVIFLTNYRNNVLLQSPLGRAFVKTYYMASPPIASVIKRSKILKHIVRYLFLAPVIAVIRKTGMKS